MSESSERPLTTADLAGSTTSDVTAPGDQTNREGDTDRVPTVADLESTPLFSGDDSAAFNERWTGVQTRFVDEPQESVKEADTLVAEVMQQLAQRFTEERQALEKQWASGSDVSTEELRQAMQNYRSFFQRLLSA